MKNYYRVMLGKKSVHAEQCLAGGFIGADHDIQQDLTGELPDKWREFNEKFRSVYLSTHPERSKIAAGLICGALWTVAKGIHVGDVVLCPDGSGFYRVGEVTGDYQYAPNGILPHRRPVRWLDVRVDRANMSEALRNSCGSMGTVSDVTAYAAELEMLIGGVAAPALIPADSTVEDIAAFAMEKHLEAFLVENWAKTELGKEFDIFEEDGERKGQQYATDTGPMDLLCVSKDKKTLLVVELKRGRASDAVVGQVLRYMGFVQEELAEEGQQVKGVIIALDDEPRVRRALAMVPAISFYRYEVSFRLLRGTP